MKQATCRLSSVAPYSQSRPWPSHVPAPARGKAEEHDELYWREKAHADGNGAVYIPPMAFKMALDDAAKMLGERIPGKGQSTYTKRFQSGVLVMDPLMVGVDKADLESDRIFVNADGVRGSGKRVWKRFPRIDEWSGDVVFHVMSDEITADVFERTLRHAGGFIGIGRFRPQSGGYYGRFSVEGVAWETA
jgi:hypothetical protein